MPTAMMTAHETLGFFRLLAQVRGVDGDAADPYATYATPLPNTTVRLWASGAVEITDRFYPIEGGVRIENQRQRIAPEAARARLMRDAGDRIATMLHECEARFRGEAENLRRNARRRRSPERVAEALIDAKTMERAADSAAEAARDWAAS